MGNDPARESATCGYPALIAVDGTQEAEPPSACVPVGDQYAARHNAFVCFHSIIDSPRCVTNVVGLDPLRRDLRNEARHPHSCSSHRTCATTGATPRARTGSPAASRRSTCS